MTPWKSFRYRLEAWACEALAWGVPRLSRPNAVRLGRALGGLAYHLDAHGRAVAAANLHCVYRGTLPPAEVRRITRASYRNFARTMVDLFWGQRLHAGNWERWVRTEGIDRMRARMAETGKGAVTMCIHQGNWEWAGLIGSFTGLQLTTVAEDFKNPRLTALFKRLREHTGQTMVAQELSLLKLLRAVRKGGTAALLIDLNLRPSQAAAVVRGFGAARLELCVPLLHAVLGQRAGALLVPSETRACDDGTVLITAHPAVEIPPGATVAEITQLCWDALEKLILSRPEDWLWPYKHFRYRPRDATTEYPFYAHESKRFEKLRREQARAK